MAAGAPSSRRNGGRRGPLGVERDTELLTLDAHGFELWGSMPWSDKVTFEELSPHISQRIVIVFARRWRQHRLYWASMRATLAF
jgi:hypothetical protein